MGEGIHSIKGELEMRRIIITALAAVAVAALAAPAANAGLLTKVYDTVSPSTAVATVSSVAGVPACTYTGDPGNSSSSCVVTAGDASLGCATTFSEGRYRTNSTDVCGATVNDTFVGCTRDYDASLHRYTSRLECGTEALHVHEVNHEDPEGATAGNTIFVHAGDTRVAEVPVPLPPSP